MSSMLWTRDFKIKGKQIFYRNQLIADVEDQWYTADELVQSALGHPRESLERFIAKNTKTDDQDILIKWLKQPFPQVLTKWLTSYGINKPSWKAWRQFEDDLSEYPRKIVKADVLAMDADQAKAFVRRHCKDNIEIWHELRILLWRINQGTGIFEHCHKWYERQAAYHHAAGQIAGLDDDDLCEIMENYR